MERTRLWPDFRGESVLLHDDDVIVVDKPSGVPSQAATPDRPDDLVTRLRAWLTPPAALAASAASPDDVYLGVHQRLDQDTSGVLLFTRRPSANPSIAKQFEGRTVTKTYLALVRGWPAGARELTLEDELAKGEDGRMVVVARPAPRRVGRGPRGPRDPRAGGRPAAASSPSPRGGQRAVTRVRVRARRGDRALLELVLETGRTHQARVQLAHAGAAIAGDTLYDGPAAPRLMLHAAELSFAHPQTGARTVVRAPVPRSFERWLEVGDLGAAVYDDDAALDDALRTAVERRWGLGRSEDRDPKERATTAFRLVNEEGDALPDLAVDLYGGHVVAQLHLGPTWDDPARRARVLDRLGALGFDGVYLKNRPKQANVLVDTRREEVAPANAVRGDSAPDEIEVREEGVPLGVRLGDGLSTGVFLDQRANRRLVRETARGARVLNLFAYTCAFTVAAAVGGASRTVSVDASIAALERGRLGLERLGLLEGDARARHTFVAEDAFTWLARAARKDERFDLVICDPPSYSSTKKRRFVAESDYDDLVALAGALLAPGGRLLASVNHRGLSRSKLRRMVGQGLRAAGREPLQIKDLAPAPEHPPAPGHDPYMKAVLATVA
jgi:23S rRNA (cytosine1962-C5)-methyltransferase